MAEYPTEIKALSLASELKKFLLERGIWFAATEVHEDRLSFIKIEASIKVKK